MDTPPEIKFFESVQEFCELAIARSQDPKEARAAATLCRQIAARVVKLRRQSRRAGGAK